jgi:hypothetical protein
MPRGGKRPGAGRPKGSKEKGTIEKELLRERLRLKVAEKLDPMIEAQIANAMGIKYLVARDKKTGKFEKLSEARAKVKLSGAEGDLEIIEVWEERPNVQAFTDLLNRTIDKPAEQEQVVAHTGGISLSWES